MAALDDPGSSRGRRNITAESATRFSLQSSRANEIEEMMMMEAIRQSLAAEEDRKKKEDKDATKKAKKEEKQKAKDQAREQKAADKASRKGGPYLSSRNASSMLSNETSASGNAMSPDEGKGKGRAHAVPQAFQVPSSSYIRGLRDAPSTLNPGAADASSSGSSFNGSGSSSLEDLPRETGSQQPALAQTQFSSLAEMIGESGVHGNAMLAGEDENDHDQRHVPYQQTEASSILTSSTRENQRPVAEGRYDGKHHEDFPSSYGNMPGRDVS